jgi:hypothetical protein
MVLSPHPSFAATVITHTLIWIGGLIFLGFFAHFAPLKTTMVAK